MYGETCNICQALEDKIDTEQKEYLIAQQNENNR